MILPSVYNEVTANYSSPYYGMDTIGKVASYSQNLRKKLEGTTLTEEEFKSFSKDIMYEFNSRGLRDAEWPKSEQELKKCYFSVGDSNVVGVGLAYEDVFIQHLNKFCNKRIINCGLANAYNYFWTTKCSLEILQQINPEVLIVVWGPFHKSAQHKTRKIVHDDKKDIELTLLYIQNLEQHKTDTKLIHVLNPIYHDFYDFFQKVNDMQISYVKFLRKDYARDGIHYGIDSHKQLAQDIYDIIKNP